MSLLRRIERGGQGGSGGGSGEPPDQSKLSQVRRRTQVPQAPGSAGGGAESAGGGNYQDLKVRVQNKLLAELDTGVDPHSPEVRTTIEELFAAISGRRKHRLGPRRTPAPV